MSEDFPEVDDIFIPDLVTLTYTLVPEDNAHSAAKIHEFTGMARYCLATTKKVYKSPFGLMEDEFFVEGFFLNQSAKYSLSYGIAYYEKTVKRYLRDVQMITGSVIFSRTLNEGESGLYLSKHAPYRELVVELNSSNIVRINP